MLLPIAVEDSPLAVVDSPIAVDLFPLAIALMVWIVFAPVPWNQKVWAFILNNTVNAIIVNNFFIVLIISYQAKLVNYK